MNIGTLGKGALAFGVVGAAAGAALAGPVGAVAGAALGAVLGGAGAALYSRFVQVEQSDAARVKDTGVDETVGNRLGTRTVEDKGKKLEDLVKAFDSKGDINALKGILEYLLDKKFVQQAIGQIQKFATAGKFDNKDKLTVLFEECIIVLKQIEKPKDIASNDKEKAMVNALNGIILSFVQLVKNENKAIFEAIDSSKVDELAKRLIELTQGSVNVNESKVAEVLGRFVKWELIKSSETAKVIGEYIIYLFTAQPIDNVVSLELIKNLGKIKDKLDETLQNSIEKAYRDYKI